MNRKNLLTFLPLLIFVGMGLVLFKGLYGDPSHLPSALIGKPAPAFDLPPVLGAGNPGLKSADLSQGKVTVVNVWASWCIPCRDEVPLLMELGKRTDIALVGINNKDEAANATRFMATLGNPFTAIGADLSGRAAIDWGVYGVPETFIVDGKGVVRHKHVGPLTPMDMNGEFLKEIEKAKLAQQE
jgi:cytochrome c biogenesis protein CcmG, thiol:disulfide interchange protein DsbE